MTNLKYALWISTLSNLLLSPPSPLCNNYDYTPVIKEKRKDNFRSTWNFFEHNIFSKYHLLSQAENIQQAQKSYQEFEKRFFGCSIKNQKLILSNLWSQYFLIQTQDDWQVLPLVIVFKIINTPIQNLIDHLNQSLKLAKLTIEAKLPDGQQLDEALHKKYSDLQTNSINLDAKVNLWLDRLKVETAKKKYQEKANTYLEEKLGIKNLNVIFFKKTDKKDTKNLRYMNMGIIRRYQFCDTTMTN